MIVKAALHHMVMTEIPTVLSPDGRSRPPHLRTWRDGWRHLRFLLLYSPNWLFLYPGLFFVLIGLAESLWLLPGPQSIGSVNLDINTLLFAAVSVLIGLQAVIFSLFSKLYAINEGLLPSDGRLINLLGAVSLERGLFLGFISCSPLV